jgi:enoyl-CoA hydratase
LVAPVVSDFTRLIVQRSGPVGWIINDRPDRLNAYDDVMRVEFRAAYAQHEADTDVAVIVHGANGRAFQVGVDVGDFGDDAGTSRYEREVTEFDLGLTGWHLGVSKPVIVAVNGVCAGGGLHWVADGDIVIAASDATFVDPHVSIGQVTAFESVGLARRAPFEAIMRMALLGSHERIDARRALQLGLISEIVDPPDRLHQRAQELAELVATNDLDVLVEAKRRLWDRQEAPA